MIKNTTMRLIIRSLFLTLSFFLITILWLNTSNYISQVIVCLSIIVQFYLLIADLNRTNQLLTMFFNSVRFDDYNISTRFSNQGKTFEELSKSLNELSRQFKTMRQAKEAQYLFNQNILHNVGVGIIAYDSDGNVAFSNKLFHSMMQIPYCNSIEKIRSFNPLLASELQKIEPRKKRIFKTEYNGLTQNYLITASDFIVNNQHVVLLVLQNIQPTIDQTEMEAWQKLIRVLTHEIMNSIAPIMSLSDTAKTLLENSTESPDNNEHHNDLVEALQTINRRSQGLIHFVQQYRNLASIPQPNLEIVSIDELFLRIGLLFRAQYNNNTITFTKEIQGNNLEIIADASLIEQVIINLLKNACQATENMNHASISLIARENDLNRVEIRVKDTGCGIHQEVIDKIFIPFFTTKPAGSGIGLSLSKQIMLMHGGNIQVSSTHNKGSEFILTF